MQFMVALSLCLICGLVHAEEFKEDFSVLSSEKWSIDYPVPYALTEIRLNELRLENGAVLRTMKEFPATSVSVEWAWSDHAEKQELADALTIILRQTKDAAILVTVHAGDGKCVVELLKNKQPMVLGEKVLSKRDSERYAIEVDHWQRVFVKDQNGTIDVYVYPADQEEPVANPVVSVRYDEATFPHGKIGFVNRPRSREGDEFSPTQESFIRRVRIKH